MSIVKPLITIDDFGGMGTKNTYYLEGFTPDNMSGQSVLSNDGYTFNKVSEEKADFEGCCDMAKVSIKVEATEGSEEEPQYITWNGEDMHNFYTGNSIDKIHTIADGGGGGTDEIRSGSSSGSSILTTKEGHLLYSSANHLGYGHRGSATGGSTTTLVDTGVDFTDIVDVTDGSASDVKVYNFTTKETYDVTGVAATTLTFATATSVSEYDQYIVFVDGKWKFNTDDSFNIHFSGQTKASGWHRRIILWEDSYFVMNGNYIARLDEDLATWSETYKQLPARSQGQEIAYNSSRQLISCDIDGAGLLILWDGKETGGFLNKIELPSSTYALTKHASAFVYNIGAKLYYTDGYSTSVFAIIPNVVKGKFDKVLDKLNNIKSVFGDIYMAISSNSGDVSIKNCVLKYSQDGGFTQSPLKASSSYKYNGTIDGIFFFRDANLNDFFVSFEDGELSTGEYSIAEISTGVAGVSDAIFNIKLPNRTKVSNVELNLAHSFKNRGSDIENASADITVSAGSGSKQFWRTGRVDNGATSTTTQITNDQGLYTNTEIGEEIFMLEGIAGGERSYVTAIADGGTANEVLTISPAISLIASGKNPKYNILPLKQAGITQTMTTKDNNKDLIFTTTDTGFTDNLFVEVRIVGNLPLDILSIKIK